MFSLGRVRPVWILVIVALLSVPSLAQTTPGFGVNEQQIRFRFDAHPVLELPVVNASDKALAGNFRIELLDTNDKVESFVTGTFRGNPGTTVEKIAWPLNSLVKVSPSSLGWRRLQYSLTPRPELGVATAQGTVQLNRVLVGGFETRMTAASIAEPGNRFPVRVRVDDPRSGKPLRGTRVELTLQLGEDEEAAIKHTVTTDYAGYAVYSFALPKKIQAD